MASASKLIGISPSIGYAAIRAMSVNMNNIRNSPPKNVDIRSSPLFILTFFLLTSCRMHTFLVLVD